MKSGMTNIIKLSSILLIGLITTQVIADDLCYLSQKKSEKAFPSLIKCYKSNSDSCCVSAHDSEIGSEIDSFLSSSCVRRFAEIEFYFCYGCHYTEPKSTNSTANTITLCKSFVERLWGSDINSPTEKFDHCGFKVGSNIEIPSKKWASASAFFADVLPPLFSGFSIQIADDDKNCFNTAPGHTLVALGVALVAYLTV
ncbi:unnamed protein product [Moneuplotes crassus]|uniref:Uncharacterized protein n=1 Tax=Euplotes crassus TaxID=5936 RepID=A0AAD2D4L8_EUPCR|nr:unnamed protein product [Moneuplotes crassus]